MSATPTYDTVMEELRIDPERIATRPAWTLQAAEKRCAHDQKVPSPTPSKPSLQQPPARQVPAGQAPAGQAHSGQLPSTPAVATT